MSKPTESYVLTLKPIPMADVRGHEIPPAARMKRLLKFAIRACGLRCVRLEGETNQTPNEQPATMRSDEELRRIIDERMDSNETLEDFLERRCPGLQREEFERMLELCKDKARMRGVYN